MCDQNKKLKISFPLGILPRICVLTCWIEDHVVFNLQLMFSACHLEHHIDWWSISRNDKNHLGFTLELCNLKKQPREIGYHV
jgi:hypothetical protein